VWAAERRPWIAPPLLFVVATLVYGIGLGDRLAVHDEIHHILAAEGLLATGEPRIAEGVYERGFLYTWLVAQSFRALGPSAFAARLPAALAGAAVVPLLFVWLRRNAGSRAAWLATVLYALSPFAIELAQFARFYTSQILAFLLAAIGLQAALAGTVSVAGRIAWLAGGLAALGLAIELQPTSLIGAAGLALWAALAVAVPWWLEPNAPRARRIGVPLAAVAGLVLAGLVLWPSGMLETLGHRYRETPLFLEPTREDFWYYHAWYSLFYPTLWPAVGLLALAGLAAWPRPGLLALAVFATAFLLSSLAGSKALRYIAYAQPFLFVLWGLGLAALWQGLARARDDLVERLGRLAPLPGAWAHRLGVVLVTGAAAWLVLANPAWLRSTALLAKLTLPGEQPDIRYDLARPGLAPALATVDLVVTTAELETLYHLGRYDVLLNRSRLAELPVEERHELGRDPRTGRPVIGAAAALEALIECTASGLIISNGRNWPSQAHLDDATRQAITNRAKPVSLPPESRVMAWTWRHPRDAATPAGCAALPPRRPPGQAP
jgi:hypothetical protein